MPSTNTLIIVGLVAAYVLLTISKPLDGLQLLRARKFDRAVEWFRGRCERDPDRRDTYLFNMAQAQHRKGDLTGAVQTLESIDISKREPTLKPFHYELLGRTLLFIENSDQERIRTCFELACTEENIRAYPILLISKGHYEAKQGNIANATRIASEFEASKADPPRRVKGLIFDEFVSFIEEYLLGYIYWRSGDRERARLHLERVLKCPYDNFYATQAREILGKLESPLV